MRRWRDRYYWRDLAETVIVLISLVVLAVWAAHALASWVIGLFA